jgi:hypothetical protein
VAARGHMHTHTHTLVPGRCAEPTCTHTRARQVRLALGLQPHLDERGRGTSTAPGTMVPKARDGVSGRRASVVNVSKDVAALFEAIAEGDYDVVKAQVCTYAYDRR